MYLPYIFRSFQGFKVVIHMATKTRKRAAFDQFLNNHGIFTKPLWEIHK